PETAAAALRELPVLRVAWVDYLDEYVAIGAPHGMRPLRLFAGFADMIADPRRRRRLHPIRVELPEPPRSAYDTHASLKERVDALAAMASGSGPVNGNPDESGPAIEILQYAGQPLLALEDRYFEGSGLAAAPLDMIVARVGANRVAERSMALLDAMERHGIVPATLSGALDLLADHRPEPLLDLAPLSGVDPYEAAEHQHRVVSELLGDALAYALVAEGKARYALSWAGVGSLVDTGGSEIDAVRLASDALASAGYAAALRAWLRELDVKLDAHTPVALHAALDADPSSPTGYLGAIAPVSGDGFATLLVTDAGLLLVRPTASERVRLAASRLGGSAPGPELVRGCLARPAASLAAESRAVHVPWAQVRALHINSGVRTCADLTLHDGRGWTLTWASDASEQGTVWPPVEHYLGHRLTTV
ncbi:MAG: hypothetical protein J2O46_05155, partial [Nocardioides sp.]|nr:hypothetical protein [Nocardioides sp.]